MKRILIVIALLISTYSSFSTNTIVLHSTRSGGFCGLFGTVQQIFLGTLNYGNTFAFDLYCSGIGFKKCRIDIHLTSNNPLNPAQQALYDFSAFHINELINQSEQDSRSGIHNAIETKQLAWDKDGDAVFDSLVVIRIEWDADEDDFNNGTAEIIVRELEYNL